MTSMTPTLELTAGSRYRNQRVYQEIYENGALTFVAAANGGYTGQAKTPWYYAFPSSFDYVFSTSNVGWEKVYGTSSTNVKGVHERTIGDTIYTHQHNPRVDILAPAIGLGGLTYRPWESDPYWNKYTFAGGDGTSVASPIVAGTAGLMLSKNPCLSPYQLEYILKKSANAQVLQIAENIKYTGRLGAGALDAGKTLLNVQNGTGADPTDYEFSCNNPATQTFFIEGIEVNTKCAPGASSNGVKPKLKPILRNGTPPYTYRWEYALGFNRTTLSALNVAEPEIVTSSGTYIGYYRLTVYDASPVQKVASKMFKIQLTRTNDFDIAARDAYMDMFNEPNNMMEIDPRESQFYKSPDIWNRQLQDGVQTHENPEFFTARPNYAYTRIRNVGCAVYPGNSYLKLYWTVGATGEKWQADWDGTTQLAGSAGGVVPGGGEITPGTGLSIPSLQPGASTILAKSWSPPRPQTFQGSPNKLCVCLLARIIDQTHGMSIPEVFNEEIITNVRNNNNIVTRNLWVNNLDALNRSTKVRTYASNVETAAKNFDLVFMVDRAIHPHFAGDFSELGYVTLYLGSLYNVWIASGGQGTYAYRDAVTKTVIFDGSNTMELRNLNLPANSIYPIDVEFSLHPGIATLPNNNYTFHLRQFFKQFTDGPKQLYGNLSFEIKTSGTGGLFRKASPSDMTEIGAQFSIYPNPASDKLSISYSHNDEITVDISIVDIAGRTVKNRKQQYFSNSHIEIDVADLITGVYLLHIVNKDGINQRFKFIKQ